VRVACAAAGQGPRVLMGDFNEWAPRRGAFQAFPADLSVLAPGRSFPPAARSASSTASW
jgi:endonuclease/exonuclease/phosphatase family metal-dependent hydrolase